MNCLKTPLWYHVISIQNFSWNENKDLWSSESGIAICYQKCTFFSSL